MSEKTLLRDPAHPVIEPERYEFVPLPHTTSNCSAATFSSFLALDSSSLV